MTRLSNTVAAGFAALTLSLAAAPQAEARYYGWGAGAVAAGIVGGAILGTALAARPAYGYYGPAYYGRPVYYSRPVYYDRPVYYGGPAYVEASYCRTVRTRAWSPRLGRNVIVRRTICD